jgi:hypothetical protein
MFLSLQTKSAAAPGRTLKRHRRSSRMNLKERGKVDSLSYVSKPFLFVENIFLELRPFI